MVLDGINGYIQLCGYLFMFQPVHSAQNEHLPAFLRQVFNCLGRMNGLKHEEIATQLNISVHTVQNHIVTAIRKLKVELKDYLPLFIFII